MHISKLAKVALIIIVVFAGTYFAIRLSFSSDGVPKQFSEARMRGGADSQAIVDYSNKISEDLVKINQLDQERKYEEALDVTTQLIVKSQDIRNKAIGLSKDLEDMTVALPGIKSEDAKQAAIESISKRLVIGSHMVNYSNYLGQILSVLGDKFAGRRTSYSVPELINQINNEINEINSLNQQAVEAMNRFDASVK